MLGGKPLLEYTVESALKSKLIDSLILTTDDQEIAEVGEQLGLEVPFIRPPELANDTAKSIDVIIHSISFLEAVGRCFDAVCLLQPTSPFRTPETIDRCIQEFYDFDLDTAMTVLKIPDEHNPEWAYREQEGGNLGLFNGQNEPLSRRQLLPSAYFREGSVYVIKRDTLIIDRTLYGAKVRGIEVDSARSVNLDTMEDWFKAEKILETLTEQKY